MNNNQYFILNEYGDPVPVRSAALWAKWFEKANRIIEQTKVGDVFVSTVFLGINHSFEPNRIVVFETLVFGGPLDGEGRRYGTMAEAKAGHAEMIHRVQLAAHRH